MEKPCEKEVARAIAVRMIEEAKQILIACDIDSKAINMLRFAEEGLKQAIRRKHNEDIPRG